MPMNRANKAIPFISFMNKKKLSTYVNVAIFFLFHKMGGYVCSNNFSAFIMTVNCVSYETNNPQSLQNRITLKIWSIRVIKSL